MQFKNKSLKKPLLGMTVSWLADECRVPDDFLWMLAKDSELMYQPTRKEPKKGGNGYREIDPPKQRYKQILKRITKIISSNIRHHPAAHGGK